MQHRIPALIRFMALIFLLLCLAPAAMGRAEGSTLAVKAPTLAPAKLSDAAPNIVVTPADIAAGDTVAVTGTGFLAAETVDVQLATTGAVTSTEHLHYFKADSAGAFNSSSLAIPSAIPAGSYDVVA